MADPTVATGRAAAAWEQLADVIRPLRLQGDGSHRVSLRLHPAELGTVHLELRMRDGVLSLRALTDVPMSREVLQQALPELREELGRSGLDLGEIDVGVRGDGSEDPGRGPDGDGAPGLPGVGAPGPAGADGIDPRTAQAPFRRPVTVGAGRVDLDL
jgi:hypothetical protein